MSEPPRSSGFLATRGLVWQWGVLALLLVSTVAVWRWRGGAHRASSAGRIVQDSVLLAHPTGQVNLSECDPRQRGWILTGYTRAATSALLSTSGIDSVTRVEILAATRCDASGCTVDTSPAMVLSLSPQSRSAFYSRLARLLENLDQHTPLRYPAGLAPWRSDRGAAPETRALLDRLAWQCGDDTCLSDVATACGRATTDEQRARLLALVEQRVVVRARLLVPHGSEVDSLARYWTGGGAPRDNDLFSRLRALATQPNGGSIAVGELLPPFARERLDTYAERDGPAFDCFWTALNFFSDPTPPPDLLSDLQFEDALARDYSEVDANAPRFGDVMVLRQEHSLAVHAVNWVAESLVFTKNGRGFLRPWQLARLSDVRRVYPDATNLRAYRRRPAR